MINAKWHSKNKMPDNATEEQRLKWHLEHSKNCNCRPMPAKLLEKIREKGITSS